MGLVGIALVGAGPWGLTLGRALAKVEQAELRWICELDDERRGRAAAAHPGARVTSRLEEVLADESVGAVAVAVDAPRHHSVGMRVLQANRHLLVEKPLALSVADADELLAAANGRGLLLSVGHLLLHHPAVRRARQMVVDGVLGESLYFESVRATPGPPRVSGSVWWALAPHDVSLAIHLFGAMPATVSVTGGAFSGLDRDNAAFATLRFADGRVAHIDVARFAASKSRLFSIAGTRRTLTFDELAPERPLVLHQSVDPAEPPISELIPVDRIDPLAAQCATFVSRVRRNDVGADGAAHAVDVVRVLAAGARSMREAGAPVEPI